MPTQSRSAAKTDVDNTITDGGNLQASEHRALLKDDLLDSVLVLEDDLAFGLELDGSDQAQIAAEIAGTGLSGGGGSALTLDESVLKDGGAKELDLADLAGGDGLANQVPLSDGSAVAWSTVPNAGLTNSSVTVAGNSVSLGGSTAVALADLSDLDSAAKADGNVLASGGANYREEGITSLTESHVNLSDLADVDTTVGNSQLTNSSVTVAGNSVSLGGSTTVALEDLSNAALPNATAAGQLPIYDATDGQFENATLTGGSGVSVTNGDASVTLAADEANIDHDALSNFVANEHIDHSGVTITGTGALEGGGDLTASRTLDVSTDGIGTDELDQSITPTWTGSHTFNADMTLDSEDGTGSLQMNMIADANQSADPSHTVWSTLAYDTDNNNEMLWISETGELWVQPGQSLVWGRDDSAQSSGGHLRVPRSGDRQNWFEIDIASGVGGFNLQINTPNQGPVNALWVNQEDDPRVVTEALQVENSNNNIQLNIQPWDPGADNVEGMVRGYGASTNWPFGIDYMPGSDFHTWALTLNGFIDGGTSSSPTWEAGNGGFASFHLDVQNERLKITGTDPGGSGGTGLTPTDVAVFDYDTGNVNVPNGTLGVGTGVDAQDTSFAAHFGSSGIRNDAEYLGSELSSDPSDPTEGQYVIWMSDGTGSGSDGDLMMKETHGGTTTTYTIDRTAV